MPGWELSVFGHPLTLAVLVPGVLVPGAFFTLLAVYLLLDRRLTGDVAVYRRRDAAIRTGIGAAGITFYGLMCFLFQAEDGIRDLTVTGVQTCALPISLATVKREL